MFGLFVKVTQDDLANASFKSKEFWKTFEENEERLVDALLQGGDQTIAILNEVDEKLKKIFPKFKKQLHFGFLLEEKEFDFAHFNHKYLKELSKVFKEEMPSSLKQRWTLNISQ